MCSRSIGTDDREFCLAYLRAAAFTKSGQDIRAWARKWMPWLPVEEIEPIMAEAAKRRRMMRADGVAGLLRVSLDERTRLELKTIGACDIDRGMRLAMARQRKRERDRERQRAKRAAENRMDRASYEAGSLEKEKPWEAEGISRRTWYRRRGTSVSRVDIYTNGDIPVPRPTNGQPDCSPQSSSQRTDREAVREWGSGTESPAGFQGAEPHGSGDAREETTCEM